MQLSDEQKAGKDKKVIKREGGKHVTWNKMATDSQNTSVIAINVNKSNLLIDHERL